MNASVQIKWYRAGMLQQAMFKIEAKHWGRSNSRVLSHKKERRLTFNLCRESPFSFTCRACSRCCRGKVILVGPHEILGMSRALGIDTTELLSRYTNQGGTALRTTEDGRCVFVGPDGCRVHAHRPLVCRLYPLGRKTDAEGRESFAMYATQPDCEAVIGRHGTVATFLESQGVEPYFAWSQRYGKIYRRMIELLGGAELDSEHGQESDPEARQDTAAGMETSPQAKLRARSDTGAKTVPKTVSKDKPVPAPTPYLSTWQDIDASLAEYCAAKGITPPTHIEAAIDLHIRAMEEWLEALEIKP
jgi:Fe-S-cluster containining protein